MRKSKLPTSVLIVRLSPAGEIVMASPVALALKQHNPLTRVVWVTQPEYAGLVQGNPHIDEVICWDRQYWRSLIRKFNLITLFKEIRAIRKRLKEENFEMAIDLQGLFKSGLLVRLSGAPLRIGLGSREGSNWFMTRSISRKFTIQEQMGAQYRYLIEQLGYQQAPWSMSIDIDQGAKSTIGTICEDQLKNEQFAVFSPFSKHPQNEWKENYWMQLSLRIRGRYHLRTVILADEKQSSQAEKLAKSIGAINLTGKLDYAESAAIMKKAKLVVGVDNDFTHIAHLYNTPTIAMFGATCPYRYTGNDFSKIIYLDKFCSPCRNHPTCNGQFNCMSEITPDLVLTEIKSLLRTII